MNKKRRLIIAGNWKMHHNGLQTGSYIAELKQLINEIDNVDVLLCPPYTSLSTAVEAVRGSRIKVGAQNVHWAGQGAFTGEISTAMLNEIPVEYVIIGHSERRQLFGETDEKINLRLHAALKGGLIPIMCVGETLEQRQCGETMAVINRQIKACLTGISISEMASIIIAYEPVWAIGTGVNATPEQAQEAHQAIRLLLCELFNETVANQIRLQYGGSVKVENVVELMAQADIDGALVGGASLKAADFAMLIKKAATV